VNRGIAALLAFSLALAACDDSPSGPEKGPPILTSISPATVPIGEDVTLSVEGRRFTSQSVITVGGYEVDTRYVSDRKLTAALSSFDLRVPGLREVRVVTLSATNQGSESSEPQTLTVQYPAPVLAGLSIDTASAGRADVVVTATGTGFVARDAFDEVTPTVARWNGEPVPTVVVSSTELRFTLGAAQLTAPGSFQVSLANRTPGGGTSATRAFTVSRPAPVITELPSAAATAGRPGFTLTIHGTGFFTGSTVEWNGVSRPAQFVSSSRIDVPVSSSDVASPGTITLRVVNAGAPTPSNTVTFAVRALASTALTSVTRGTLRGVRDLVWDEGTGRLYVSLASTSGTLGNTLTAIDPANAQVTGSVFVGSEPGRLARSTDGQYVYVGLDGAAAVRRVTLASLTANLQFSIGSGVVAGDMVALPGLPGSVAVSIHRRGISPPLEGVAVFDEGTRRARASDGHTGGARIEAGSNASVIYGFNNAHTGFEFFTIGLDASGARHTSATGGLIGGFSTDIVSAAGRVYGTDGSIVDPERRVRIGSFPGGGLLLPDPQTGHIYVLRDGAIQVYDMNTFQSLGQIPLPTGITFDFSTSYRMVRTGRDGIALFDSDEVIVVRSAIIAG
jgi:hypothetical protein